MEGKWQRVYARLGQKQWQQDQGALLCPQGAATFCLCGWAELLPSPLRPSPGCQGTVLADLPTSCLSQPCPELTGLEVPARQPKVAAFGKDALSRQPNREGRQPWSMQSLVFPGAEVELTLLITGDGLSPPSHFRSWLWCMRAFPFSLSRPTSTMVPQMGQTKHSFMGRASLLLTLSSRAGSASCQAAGCKATAGQGGPGHRHQHADTQRAKPGNIPGSSR